MHTVNGNSTYASLDKQKLLVFKQYLFFLRGPGEGWNPPPTVFCPFLKLIDS